MNPFKRFFHLASRFAVRLFPIRPYFLGGAFVGLLGSLGDVVGNTLDCILGALDDVVGDTLGCIHVSLDDVVGDTLGYVHISLGDVVGNTLVYIYVCVVVPWILAIHIPTSPFLLLRAGNHPD